MPNLRLPWLLPLLLAGLVGCGGDAAPNGGLPDGVELVQLDEHRFLGAPLHVENLTVWPVYTDAPLDVGPFLTLDEAQARGLASVREVGAPAPNASPPTVGQRRNRDREWTPPRQTGQVVELQGLEQAFQGGGAVVNRLVIENRADVPLLVCAGTIVKGGNQDRQIGQDFVVQANGAAPVDAFCVEQGRWSARVREGEAPRGLTDFVPPHVELVSPGMVAPKSVRAGGHYQKDQGEVWTHVRVVLDKQGVKSDTQTLLACSVDADDEVRKSRAAYEEAVLDRFRTLSKSDSAPVGFAYAIDGTPVTVRAFAHARLLEGQLGAFAKAMAMEADLARRSREADEEAPASASAEAVVRMVKRINESKVEYEATQAGNWNGYRKAKAGFNGTCFLPDERGQRSDVFVTVDWTSR